MRWTDGMLIHFFFKYSFVRLNIHMLSFVSVTLLQSDTTAIVI